MKLTNSYLTLGEAFYKPCLPRQFESPTLMLWNKSLASELGITESLGSDEQRLAELFCGKRLLPGVQPVALAYAGHQFGNFSPQLGDGRAHLLGELEGPLGQRVDIQLKGSGPTPFSRGGDGLCAMGPALREFVMSEAMHALGVPTTRSLAVVATGEMLYRQSVTPGAVVTRVAASHLRVGTVQYFAAQGRHEEVKRLCDYTIDRHYPEIIQAGMSSGERYLALLDAAMARQITLVCHWMRVGLIHGVMNTDNTALSGETIDYGPCAMLGRYKPDMVFSSIDTHGRYAFNKQPDMVQWNISRLAECLIPLVDDTEQLAVDKLVAIISTFPQRFNAAYHDMMSEKLGLDVKSTGIGENKVLIDDLLSKMQEHGLDYTDTFNALTEWLAENNNIAKLDKLSRENNKNRHAQILGHLSQFLSVWQERVMGQDLPLQACYEKMRFANPVVIPRNHHVEACLAECISAGSADKAMQFLSVLMKPYERCENTALYEAPSADDDKGYKTFCGT